MQWVQTLNGARVLSGLAGRYELHWNPHGYVAFMTALMVLTCLHVDAVHKSASCCTHTHTDSSKRSLLPACRYVYEYSNGRVDIFAIYFTPISPGVTRSFFKFVSQNPPKGFALISKVPQWLFHNLSGSMSDQDAVMLHTQVSDLLATCLSLAGHSPYNPVHSFIHILFICYSLLYGQPCHHALHQTCGVPVLFSNLQP